MKNQDQIVKSLQSKAKGKGKLKKYDGSVLTKKQRKSYDEYHLSKGKKC